MPHLNLGTLDGRSCAPSLRAAVVKACQTDPRWTLVVDDRFKGGYITRRYGQPSRGLHAVQLEMCWRTYMQESPIAWNPDQARAITPMLHGLVETLAGWRPM